MHQQVFKLLLIVIRYTSAFGNFAGISSSLSIRLNFSAENNSDKAEDSYIVSS